MRDLRNKAVDIQTEEESIRYEEPEGGNILDNGRGLMLLCGHLRP